MAAQDEVIRAFAGGFGMSRPAACSSQGGA